MTTHTIDHCDSARFTMGEGRLAHIDVEVVLSDSGLVLRVIGGRPLVITPSASNHIYIGLKL